MTYEFIGEMLYMSSKTNQDLGKPTIIRQHGINLYKIHYECCFCGMTTDFRNVIERHIGQHMAECIPH